MVKSILQARIADRGLVLDPRTKMLLLLTMSVFVLGYAGGEDLAFLMPVFCALPALALISAKKWKQAVLYCVIYSLSYMASVYWIGMVKGNVRFILYGICGILSRILPGLMMGAYVVGTTTVSEFTAGMLRLHLSEKIIIPLSVMFRFFPTVIDESASISAAMRMRDIRFGGKNIAQMLEYRLVPLITCCAQIGEELSAAALTRGLGGTIKRTNVCKIGFHVQDYLVIGLCIVPYVLLIFKFMGVMR